MNERETAVRKAISRTRWASIGIAAVLSPIPLADEIVFFGLYGWMTNQIGKAYGLPFKEVPWGSIGQTVLTGLVARAGLNLAFATLPGVAAVANAASAAALTEAIGRYTADVCSNPAAAKPVGLAWFKDHFSTANGAPQ